MFFLENGLLFLSGDLELSMLGVLALEDGQPFVRVDIFCTKITAIF